MNGMSTFSKTVLTSAVAGSELVNPHPETVQLSPSCRSKDARGTLLIVGPNFNGCDSLSSEMSESTFGGGM